MEERESKRSNQILGKKKAIYSPPQKLAVAGKLGPESPVSNTGVSGVQNHLDRSFRSLTSESSDLWVSTPESPLRRLRFIPEFPDTPPEGEAAVTGDFSGVFTGVSGQKTGVSGLGAESPAWKLQKLLKPKLQHLEFGNSKWHETNFVGKRTTRATPKIWKLVGDDFLLFLEWNLLIRETRKITDIENATSDKREIRFRWTRACHGNNHKL